MADSVVQSTVSNLLGRTIDLLMNEVNLLRGVDDQVRTLQGELRWIHAFLGDANAVMLKEGDDRLQVLLSEFRDIAYDAEDAIDAFILKVASVRNRGFWGLVKRSVGIFSETRHRHLVGTEIQNINSRISAIRERSCTYGVQSIAGTSTTNRQPRLGWRRSYAHEEEDVVGLDKDIKKLVAELTNKKGRARVVSIVGMGGSGKTILARKLYNHVDIKKHFECQAWVSISQELDSRDLLINIVTKTTSPSDEKRKLIQKMSTEDLVIEVHNFLKQKTYLVVLDDVWENKVWDELRPAFPSENMGSKLIITTQIQNVAPHADPNGFVHTPRSLTDEEAWKLLLQKVKGVIRDDRREEANRFHELGKEMVKKCSGLPLAIVVLGGLLAAKKSLEEWKKVSQNIGVQLRKAGKEGSHECGQLFSVLTLSYDNLPYYLKPCFLYLGAFPGDSKIRVKPLIRMWIAEGFISSSSPQIDREETLEQAGEAYLQDLIQRNLIQVAEMDTTGRPKSCLMHDLLRDLCLQKAREESFLEVCSSSKPTIAPNARRIAVHFGDNADYTKRSLLGLEKSRVRSLLCFGSICELSKSEWKIVCTNLPLLRVLHLQVDLFRCSNLFGDHLLPKRIGNLYLLKYLGLANRNRLEFPQSLGNLRGLQTLDVRSSIVGRASLSWYYAGGEVVQKMKQLRYFHFGRLWIDGSDFKVGGLENLQCLKHVEARDWMARNLRHLTNLQKLGIGDIKNVEQLKAVLESPCIISDGLESFHLDLSINLEEYPSLEQLSRCRNLSKLNIRGKIREEVQLQLQLPPCLTKLSLIGSKLWDQDPMAALEKLPFLKFLLLGEHSYKGTQMTCSANGFPQLQQLQMEHLPRLKEWIVEEGTMPHLKHLMIYGCQELRMIPEGLKFITTLQELKIWHMPVEFENRVRKVDNRDAEATSDPHQGADHYKIRHIPTVMIKRGSEFEECRLSFST
ncbi:NB-ARC [Dillenia turbinata]|uniref:NB-ARC n=1 Tax=Dillenia turbinata TaxID=194707 RepID=A0AAN8W6U8_9MAGN